MKRRPRQWIYQLYRLQQKIGITDREAKAMGALLGLILLGLIVAEYREWHPTYDDAFYAETDSLFAAATAALKNRDSLQSKVSGIADSLGESHLNEALAIFKPAFPININTASPAELEQLPRIGAKMAERIVAYRSRRGGFRNIEELLLVRGIGEKTFEQLQPLVVID